MYVRTCISLSHQIQNLTANDTQVADYVKEVYACIV